MNSEPLHPQIARFVEQATDEMSPAQVASILGRSEATVKRWLERGMMESLPVKDARGGTGKTTWLVNKAALLGFIVRSTHGRHDIVLAAIAEMCPRWLKLAEQIAQAPADGPLPENIIDLATAKKRVKPPRDPFEGHPDLFASQAAG